MKNKIMLILIIIAVLFSTGCSQTYNTIEYKAGTEGLVIEFSKSNPESVYEGEEFGNSFVINNKGSYNVNYENPGNLIISYDTYRLRSNNPDGEIELTDIHLQGKNKVYPVGEDFPFEVYFISDGLTHLRESSKTKINYNLCYPYTTELATMTCIDTTTVTRSKTVSACKVENYNGANGQGAPIVITKIEPEILMQQNYARPQFKIYIENVGKGYVTNTESCNNADINDIQSSGKVNVRAWLSSKERGRELQCGPEQNSGVLRLSDSESYIRCYLPTNTQGYDLTKRSYVTPLIVEVRYTYIDITTQEVEILRNDVLTDPVTQGLCASYQVDDHGTCVSKCEYCSQPLHQQEFLCNNPTLKPYAGFTFTTGFTCSCEKAECDEKLGKGSCIKGYCPGELYCCSTNNCDQYQVEYNGKCIDKCEYCSKHNSSDTQICSGYNFTGFNCEDIDEAKCNSYLQYNSCIKGYCGGKNINMYCANSGKATSIMLALNLSASGLFMGTGRIVQDLTEDALIIPNDKTPEIVNPIYLDAISESGLNRCDYCSQDKTDNPLCKFKNNDVVSRVSDTFSCICNHDDKSKLRTHEFVPNKEFCDNNMYCCDLMGIQFR